MIARISQVFEKITFTPGSQTARRLGGWTGTESGGEDLGQVAYDHPCERWGVDENGGGRFRVEIRVIEGGLPLRSVVSNT